jgi:DNA-binding CsgD family transcriptional regulator
VTPVAVVGRDRELAAVNAFLEALQSGRAVLVVEGEAGIGKTTVWQAGITRAVERGMTVLSSRPGSSETRLTFVGLADLLQDVDESVFDGLPAPQRRALDVALLRADPDGDAPEQRVVSTAFLSVLRALSETAPVVVAVDDLQWLDTPSRHVLEFALRRIDPEPVGVLAAVRLEGESSWSVEGARRLRLGPLNLAELFEVIRAELGKAFPRPTLVRIEHASGGNPFFALELARAVMERGEPLQGSAPLPVPDDLGELILGRLSRLAKAIRDMLLAAAALSQPTLDLLDRAAVERAEAAGLVRSEGHRVTFSHPLIASAVYGAAPPSRRREVHRALAERVPDQEERARHLALAAEGPDETVASALLDAAAGARGRGAPDAALELAELSCALTPADRAAELHARRLELAGYLSEAGDPEHARAVLERIVEEAPSGPVRAQALILLAYQVEWGEGSEAAAALCDRALADAGGDLEAQARIHGDASRMSDHDVSQKMFHARKALELTEGPAPNPTLRSLALLAFAEATFHAGGGIDRAVFEQASALELKVMRQSAGLVRRVHHFSDERPSERLLGTLSMYADDLVAAREQFERERRIAFEHGDDSQLARTLARLAIVELKAGNWDEARSHLDAMRSTLERTGQTSGRRWQLTIRALLEALAGRVEAARSAGEDSLAAMHGADLWGEGEARAALGFLELSLGKLPDARVHLDRAQEIERQIGLKEPCLLRYHADHVETLAGLGELERAERATDWLEQQGRSTAHAWPLAVAARSRGLVAAASGDLDGAARALERALAEHERLPVPFELGRTLLVKGQVHRRRNERRLARVALDESITVFERLGSPPWAEKARAEVGRLGVRRGARDELTPTEEKIAALAATGLTNRQIAERTFVSPKTVEANLSRVYRKLGIHSRAELGARMAGRESLAKQ